MFAHLAPDRSLVDELIADRRAEAWAENEMPPKKPSAFVARCPSRDG